MANAKNVYYYHRLPADFPSRFQVCLREQVYDHKRELWAHFRYGGDRFKIVVEEDEGLLPQPGEKWELAPMRSPNGYTVFARPLRRLRTAH